MEHWTVLSDEVGLASAKQEGTRLAFALLLKYFTQHGRFPRGWAEFPDEVVDYVAKQTKTSARCDVRCLTNPRPAGHDPLARERRTTDPAEGGRRWGGRSGRGCAWPTRTRPVTPCSEARCRGRPLGSGRPGADPARWAHKAHHNL
ncbi:DUF4158 domain-containing protein [Nonomuraea sp. NPDC050451]|uniref:DUF4158 domain-containing protein n=1 Tax=Nonomuraea sp. NPDC050451 TaxID=3364364 RepID=UPI0037B8FFA7